MITETTGRDHQMRIELTLTKSAHGKTCKHLKIVWRIKFS